MKKIRFSPFTFVWIALIIMLLLRPIFNGLFTSSIDISKAITLIQNDRVDEASINGDTLYINDVTNSANVTYKTGIPKQLQDSFYKDYLKDKVESGKIKFTAVGDEEEGLLKTILPYAFMGILFFFMMNMIFKQTGSQNKEMNNFAKSKAKLFNKNDKEKVTFKDVAGLEEEKVELYEIVDFLKNPAKYARMGARIPRGVLLVGPPGTGKTYISRAVAGEAGVPFFSISGSEFLEMFVGVGASRVRDLFDVAKKNSPCIIFIDEIDAVGRKRGSGLGGGHDEREQTLNQLLVEMDGFEKNEGIIMMAATNRPDILDDALLRPGRFDRRVTIGLPDVRGREEILNIHTKDKPMAADVDIKNIAKRTPGFTPADLENLVNEAAILSARHGQNSITKSVLEEASIKVLAGPEKTSTVITPEEKKLVSFHEAGHAIVTKSLPDTDPVQMVTIVPRGSAGGFTYTVPEEEKYYYTKSKMINEIIILLAGRAAEELKLEDISTGASNDIERATKIAHAMVSKYGMTSAIGTLDFTEDNENIFIGNAITHSKNVSEETLKLIDSEMKRIVDGCYEKAKEILRENDEKLTRLANCLLEKETVYKKEFEAIYSGDYDPSSFEDEKINIF
ncbi:MAG: ATP-dependent zinc metalloprotease FtsH [Ezakiella sp.]|uniref:ATP-dependent zinc metalloprotease FtsH n=1 Tax=Ezakiella sp. TaxID=1935205 RepID=UPI00297418B3|nr:ATP-dependent zinc metalloprotease FtsH [Ezakiella sp.]MDD7731443.1 ATP-dependent zinc metalloprotease FtsH [Eubacteriales bacterium]MDY6080265.1 ATP-dependent zinc metalloprotease FtsH [Ezakiella sp.]